MERFIYWPKDYDEYLDFFKLCLKYNWHSPDQSVIKYGVADKNGELNIGTADHKKWPGYMYNPDFPGCGQVIQKLSKEYAETIKDKYPEKNIEEIAEMMRSEKKNKKARV